MFFYITGKLYHLVVSWFRDLSPQLGPRISVPGRFRGAGVALGPIGGGGAPTKQYINRWANARLTGKAGPGGVVECHIIAVQINPR
jgi:hypothetical protein